MGLLRVIWRLVCIFADSFGRLYLGAADKWWMAIVSILVCLCLDFGAVYAGVITPLEMKVIFVVATGVILTSTFLRRKLRVRNEY